MTNNEKAEQIAKIFADAQEKLQALLKPELNEDKKNIWLDRLNREGGYFYSAQTTGNETASVRFWFKEHILTYNFATYLDKNARRFYAEYVLQQILERDYMPEPLHNTYVHYCIWKNPLGVVVADAHYGFFVQGTIFCTAKPDVQKIQDEMGEIFDWLWER